MSHTRPIDAGMPLSGPDAAAPMRAARCFVLALRDDGLLHRTWRIKCELYGALGAAGRGHDRDKAVMLGLEGEEPDRIDPAMVARRLRRIHDKRELHLLGTRRIAFDRRRHLSFLQGGTSSSPCDGVRLSAFDPAGTLLLERDFAHR